MSEINNYKTETLLNFVLDETKEIKADIKEINSKIVTKEYCQTMQGNCPSKNTVAKGEVDIKKIGAYSLMGTGLLTGLLEIVKVIKG